MNKSGILYIVIFVLVLVFSFNIDVDAEVDKGSSQNVVSQVKAEQTETVINHNSLLTLLEKTSAEANKVNALDQMNSNRAGYVMLILALALALCLILAYKNGLLFTGQTKRKGKMWYDIKEHMND